jgi:hypothetical protein
VTRQLRRKADVVLGKTLNGKDFVLTEKGRRLHVHIPGLSGMGKSSLIENMIRQDILNGQGVILIDPDGSLYNRLVPWAASWTAARRRKIRLVNVAEISHRFGFNPLRVPEGHEIAGVVDTVMSAVATAWGGANLEETPLLQKCLGAMFALLAANGLTLCEFPYLLREPDGRSVREHLLDNVDNAMHELIWDQISQMNNRDFHHEFQSSVNRISAFLDTPVVRSIVGQRVDVVDLQRSMDEGEVILINLEPNQQLGFSSLDARLLGNLIVAGIVSAAMARPADVSRPCWLYIDEAYAFINRDIEMLLDRCRKRGLHLALAHQRLGQLYERSQAIGDSVVEGGQCKIIFRLVGQSAAEMGYQVFGSTFNLEEPKKSLIRPVVVGHKIALLKGRSKGRGTNTTHTDGRGESENTSLVQGTAHTVIHAETESEAEADSFAESDSDAYSNARGVSKGSGSGTNYSHTDSISEPDTGGFFEIREPTGTIGTADSYGASASTFTGESSVSGTMHAHSSVRGATTIRGRAVSDGTADSTSLAQGTGRGTQSSQTDAQGTSETESESEQEALWPILEERSGGNYSLEELKHRAAMRLANLPERHAIVKVQNLAPIEIIVEEVLPAPAAVNPRRVGAFTALLTQSDEYTKPVAMIEQELAERPMKLIQAAAEWRHTNELAARQAESDEDFDE